MNPNLNINSNVYLMPENFSYSKISDRHITFIQHIKDRTIFNKLSETYKNHGTDFQRIDNFGVCSSHPSKALSFGPIRINDQIEYGCRCNFRNECRNRINILRNDCKKCSMNKD